MKILKRLIIFNLFLISSTICAFEIKTNAPLNLQEISIPRSTTTTCTESWKTYKWERGDKSIAEITHFYFVEEIRKNPGSGFAKAVHSAKELDCDQCFFISTGDHEDEDLMTMTFRLIRTKRYMVVEKKKLVTLWQESRAARRKEKKEGVGLVVKKKAAYRKKLSKIKSGKKWIEFMDNLGKVSWTPQKAWENILVEKIIKEEIVSSGKLKLFMDRVVDFVQENINQYTEGHHEIHVLQEEYEDYTSILFTFPHVYYSGGINIKLLREDLINVLEEIEILSGRD